MVLKKVNKNKMLRRVSRFLKFSQFSRISASDFNHNQLSKSISTSENINAKYNNASVETKFIAQFIPNYVGQQNEKFIFNHNLFKIEDDYSEKSVQEMLDIFEELSCYCEKMEIKLSREEYKGLIEALISKLPQMSDEEICKVLVNLTKFPSEDNLKAKNFCELWNQLDSECWMRSKFWKSEELLKYMYIFYKLGLSKTSKFKHKALLKLARKTDDLEPRMLVEMMFYQSFIRHKDVSMYNIEARFNQIFNKLNINEIGIVSLAFFKREAKLLKEELIEKVYRRVN
jgi:hypothetical protein